MALGSEKRIEPMEDPNSGSGKQSVILYMQFTDSEINDGGRVLLEYLTFLGRDVWPLAM